MGADGIFRLQELELLTVLFLDDDFRCEKHSLGEMLDRDQFLHGFFIFLARDSSEIIISHKECLSRRT